MIGEARLLILYRLDSLNLCNAMSPAGDIGWEERERRTKGESKVLDSLNTYNGHLGREREENERGKQGC